jgi:hypothetical protein
MFVSRNHILPVPKGLLVLRCFQLATAVAILGLSAYGIYWLSFDGDNLTMFSAIASIIIVTYILVAQTALPAAYNYWAILGLDIFAIVFWIISFSLLASEVAAFTLYSTYTTSSCLYTWDGVCYYKAKRAVYTTIATYRNAMAAAAGLGGLEFILFTVTLVFQSIYLHRHRKAGGHCMPTSASTVPPPVAGMTDAEQGYPQQGAYAPQQAYAPQPQPGYVQPPQQTYTPQPGYPQQVPPQQQHTALPTQ